MIVFITPQKECFQGILESASLFVRVSVHVSVCVQNTSNFVAGIPPASIVLKRCTYIDHILKVCKPQF